jgi:hypothetical protein
MTTANGPAPAARTRPRLRRTAVWVACAAVVASSVASCNFTDSGTPATAPASASTSAAVPALAKTPATATADAACPEALEAVSSYVQGKESLDKIEIDLIVLGLKEAAHSAGNSKIKQSIINLLSEYLQLRDSLSDAVDSAVEQKILANTSNLKSECGS